MKKRVLDKSALVAVPKCQLLRLYENFDFLLSSKELLYETATGEERGSDYYKIIKKQVDKNKARTGAGAGAGILDVTAGRGAKSTIAIQQQNAKAALLFSEGAGAAAKTVVTLNGHMRDLATTLSGPVSTSIKKFTGLINDITDIVKTGKENKNDTDE